LALAQAGAVAASLKKKNPGLEIETIVIKTSGDLFASAAPSRARSLSGGTKGLFVKEIEEALSGGRIDFAVHSAKDLPADLADGLVIAAYPKREDSRDVFIGRDGASWKQFPKGGRLATSSLRRQRQLASVRSDISFLPMRGNVDTRLKKLEQGLCDGLVLAGAGLIRLGKSDLPREFLPESVVVPAPGQGALALEADSERRDVISILAALDDGATRIEVEIERALLRAVGGGCATPLGVSAKKEGKGARVAVFWADPEGNASARLEGVCPDPGQKDAFARQIAAKIKSGLSKNA